ncbi:MAG: hypothetical protein HY898_09030 [Deltaproteobacteria bacterium]|nr:hypothetical protein [Deltaproteobacteria bacterium]
MNEPTRWRQSGPEEVRELLRHAAAPRAMTAAERDRMARRVARIAAIPAGLGVLFWVKGMALGAVIGAISLTAAVSLQRGWIGGPSPSEHVAPRQASTRAPLASAPLPAATQESPATAADPAPAPAPSPLAVGTPSSASVEADAAPDARVDTLAEEAALLEEARAAVSSNPARALELSQQHASRYPKGQMGMERELVAIEALNGLGRVAEARARAGALLARSRGSLYEDRIRNLFPEAPAAASAH